jgi:TatD DNase family protein
MLLVDVHAHLDYYSSSDEIDSVISRAKSAGVKAIITNSVDPISMNKTLELTKKYDMVKPALGIYPPDALDRETDYEKRFDIDSALDFIEKNADKAFAIGECGMDFKNVSDKDLQVKVFKRQLDIAMRHKKPIIVHSRKAEQEVVDIIEQSGYKKVVLHCFCGRKSLARHAAELDLYFSIPTNVVRSDNLKDLVKIVNINKLLTETDCPFLSPFPDKKNEPAFVLESVKKIAEIKGFTVEETANNIWLNYQRLFL